MSQFQWKCIIRLPILCFSFGPNMCAWSWVFTARDFLWKFRGRVYCSHVAICCLHVYEKLSFWDEIFHDWLLTQNKGVSFSFFFSFGKFEQYPVSHVGVGHEWKKQWHVLSSKINVSLSLAWPIIKTVSTIELVFCGHILQNIIIRKKKEWTSSSGPLGDSKVTPFYESELEELWEFTGGGITVGSDSWQRLLGKIWSQSL